MFIKDLFVIFDIVSGVILIVGGVGVSVVFFNFDVVVCVVMVGSECCIEFNF